MFSFINITDLHLSPRKPLARTELTNDEFVQTQIDKLTQVFTYAREQDIHTVICAGDTFDKAHFNNSIYFIIRIIQLFNAYSDINFITLWGNHDLRYGDINSIKFSLLGLLSNVCPNFIIQRDTLVYNLGTKTLGFDFFHYGEPLVSRASQDINVAVLHENIFEHKVPKFMSGYSVKELGVELPNYDLYLCGHNHQKFCSTTDKYSVINGGSMMRLNTQQKEFKPSFWHVDVTTTNMDIREIPFNIRDNMIDDNHIIVAHEKKASQESMQAYLELIKSADSESFDFTSNLLNKINTFKPHTLIRTVLQEVYEEIQEDR